MVEIKTTVYKASNWGTITNRYFLLLLFATIAIIVIISEGSIFYLFIYKFIFIN